MSIEVGRNIYSETPKEGTQGSHRRRPIVKGHRSGPWFGEGGGGGGTKRKKKTKTPFVGGGTARGKRQPYHQPHIYNIQYSIFVNTKKRLNTQHDQRNK